MTNKYIFHITKSDWGYTIFIMENNGNAFMQLAWYHDDNTTAYISSLSVNENVRQNKIGTELMNLAETISKKLGIKYI